MGPPAIPYEHDEHNPLALANSYTWLLPPHWIGRLGHTRAQIVYVARRMVQDHRPVRAQTTRLHVSAEEIAACCGVSSRTICRCFAPDPEGLSLSDLLALAAAQPPRTDSLGRRKAKTICEERLRNAYLRLFLRVHRTVRYDTASGRYRRWKYAIDVLSTDLSPLESPSVGDMVPGLEETLIPKQRRQVAGGYIAVSFYNPPVLLRSMIGKSGYLLEHRMVMDIALGRPLSDCESVHHINGDRMDNRLENLQLRHGNHGSGQCLQCRECGSADIVHIPIAQSDKEEMP